VDLEEPEARNDCAGESQQQFNRRTEWLVHSVERCCYENWNASSWGRGQFRNLEEERSPMEVATKQRVVKIEKTFMCCS
jgi:hypothetical protein